MEAVSHHGSRRWRIAGSRGVRRTKESWRKKTDFRKVSSGNNRDINTQDLVHRPVATAFDRLLDLQLYAAVLPPYEQAAGSRQQALPALPLNNRETFPGFSTSQAALAS